MVIGNPLDALARDIADAANDIEDMDAPRREAADLLAETVRGEAPYVSGFLASSVHADGEGVGVDAVYAGVVHDSNPYAERALDLVDWVQPFADHVDESLRRNIRPYYS